MKNRGIISLFVLHFLIILHRLNIVAFLRFFAKKEQRDIAIIKLDAIGDSIIFLSSAELYKQIYPNRHITLYCQKTWMELALKSGYFDEVIDIDIQSFKHSIKYRFKTCILLSKKVFNTVLLPSFSRDFFYTDWLVHQLRAKTKIAWKADYSNTSNSLIRFCSHKKAAEIESNLFKIANRYYTDFVPTETLDIKHEILRHFEWFSMLSKKSIVAQAPSLNFVDLDPSIIYKIDPRLNLPFALISLGASTKRKAASPAVFAKQIEQLPPHFNLVFTGTLNETNFLSDLDSFVNKTNCVFNYEHRRINILGKSKSLLELLNLANFSEYVIANDSALSHIAPAVNTPSTCFLGGGHWGRFQPYPKEIFTPQNSHLIPKVIYNEMNCFGCNWVCKYPLENGKWKCINALA